MRYFKKKNDHGYYYKVGGNGGLEVRSLEDFERISKLTEDSIDHVLSDFQLGKLEAIESEVFYEAYNKVQETVNKLIIKL